MHTTISFFLRSARRPAGLSRLCRYALPLIAAAITLCIPAHANNLLWNFSYTGGTFPNYGPNYDQPDVITGQLTTTGFDSMNNDYTIIGITGLDNGSPITGLDPAGGYTDNLLFASGTLLDFNGFSFTTAAGNDINLYFNASNGYYWDWYDHGTTIVQNGTFVASPATAAPEPSTLMSIGAIFLLAGAVRWKRCGAPNC